MDSLFLIENLKCSYDRVYCDGISKVVLEIKKLNLPKGKIIFIVGESGIGKSTILETLGMMNNTIVPSSDTKFNFYDNQGKEWNLVEMWRKGKDRELSNFRLNYYSFIFQSTNLMRNFTAFENISFTRMLQGYTQYSCYNRTRKVLSELGLEHIDEHRMAQELSGGQQQRLAFARAILPDFNVLFGDEPTGNLDGENAVLVMKILSQKLKELEGASAVIVSHDMHLAVTFADIIIKIRKEYRPKLSESDEDVTYGMIDESCLYTPNDDGTEWTNDIDAYSLSDFEKFLRRK